MKLHHAHGWLLAGGVLSFLACSSSTPGSSPGSGGKVGTGGSSATGGSSSTGGSRATGGMTGSGGNSGSGGRPGSGGATATGGASGTGGGTGGDSGSGSGGRTSTGGATSSGGRTNTGGTTGVGGATGAGDSTHSGTWRIMPLGDSITVTTCYPQFLSKELTDKGKTGFIFVGGDVCNQICGSGVPHTVCEGQGGMWATNLMSGGSSASLLPQWCSTDQADVALVHFGTNDIWGTQPTQKILDAFSQIVDALRAAVPSVIVFVAQIIPMNPENCLTCEARLEELNAAIPSWATSKSTAASPVYPVDLWSALPQATYTAGSAYTKDGVHPEPPAAQIMADTWYQALVAKGIP